MSDETTLRDLTDQPGGLNLGSGVRLVWTEREGYSYVYDGPMSS